MPSKTGKHLHTQVKQAAYRRLLELASELRLFSPKTGAPSLSAMLDAIGDGRLVLTWAEGLGPDSKRGRNAED